MRIRENSTFKYLKFIVNGKKDYKIHIKELSKEDDNCE